jgi:hypothetical protein
LECGTSFRAFFPPSLPLFGIIPAVKNSYF